MCELSLPRIMGPDLTLEHEFVLLKSVYYILEGIMHLWIILVN